MVLAASALFAFFLLFAIDLTASHPNPYIGILAYLIAPLFFLLGIFLTFLGAIIRWRTRRRAVQAAEPLAIKIDLSRPRDRRILALFGFGSMDHFGYCWRLHRGQLGAVEDGEGRFRFQQVRPNPGASRGPDEAAGHRRAEFFVNHSQ